uniref:HTH luxR-type domain-containing protein n=1 Tax=Ascaris lumbricoides TaxID=6252 RepID=A0A0M3I7T6_ASCLU
MPFTEYAFRLFAFHSLTRNKLINNLATIRFIRTKISLRNDDRRFLIAHI